MFRVLLAVAMLEIGVAGADTRLADAAMDGNKAAVRALLKAGADANIAQADGATALHWAAHRDDLELADLLLEAKAAVNATNELGVTPLWLACQNASPAMVKTLLQAGANPNIALSSGETPLMTAARTGNADVVRLLVARGAAVNTAERAQGQTALMWAVAERHPQVVRALLEAGADIHARTAVRPRRVNTDRGGFNGATATDIEKGGYTPLMFAAQQGEVESISLLIAAGADVNEVAPEGTSALVVAAHSGHSLAARALLDKGADPSAAGAGYTALHAAILRGDIELVHALLARGASPNVPLLKPTPVRRSSADYGFESTLVGATPFWLAARFLEPAIMRALLAKGADPLFTMKDGTTALAAVLQGRRTVEPGFAADPVRDESLAVEAAQIAIAGGVDVNAADKDGDTALHAAAQRRLNGVVQLLAEKGATLDAKNQKGQTPLAIAAAAGGPNQQSPTADLLRKLGARD